MRTTTHSGSMRGELLFMIQALLWPAVSALFRVEVERKTYTGHLHGDVKLQCGFSEVQRPLDLSVIWHRVEPKPDVEVFRLERGRENTNYTSVVFRERAQLIQEQLQSNRAVLHLQKLRIKDSGTYQCILKEGDEGDYKHMVLTVTAPYTTIKKHIHNTGKDEVELTCESHGFPAAQVVWRDGQNTDLTEKSNSTTNTTDEDLIHIISRLTVKQHNINNYTCTLLTEGEIKPYATFRIPDEIPICSSSQSYVWIGAVAVVLLAVTLTSVILHRKKNGQKVRRDLSSVMFLPPSPSLNDLPVNENSPQTFNITSEVSKEKPELLGEETERNSELITNTEMKRRSESYCKDVLPYTQNRKTSL